MVVVAMSDQPGPGDVGCEGVLDEAEVSMASPCQRGLACMMNVRIHPEPAMTGQAFGFLEPLTLSVRRDSLKWRG